MVFHSGFIVIFSFIALQILIGLWVSKRINTFDDYFLAGRKGNRLLITFSMFATWFGSETCISSASLMYQNGLSGGKADPFGYALCLILFALFFASRIWQSKVVTISDLLLKRYGVGVEFFCTVISIWTSIFWAASQIRALGHVFTIYTDLELKSAIYISTMVVVIYTTMGGILGDLYTDFIQGIVLSLGLLILFCFAFPNMYEQLGNFWQGAEGRLDLFAGDASLLEKVNLWIIPALGSLVAQELLIRAAAANSQETAKSAALWASLLYLAIGLLPAILGLFGPQLLPGLNDSEQYLLLLAKNYLPSVLFLFFSWALVSVILSTVDSSLLAVGSLLANNLLPRIKPNLGEKSKHRLFLGRVCVLCSGIVAGSVSLYSESIFELVELASSFGTAGLLVCFIFAFTNFGSKSSAIAAIGSGFATTLIWDKFFTLQISFLASIIAAVLSYFITALIEQIIAIRFFANRM